jgi:prepilin-type N-terminal cleavage/methylation domain-containing protein
MACRRSRLGNDRPAARALALHVGGQRGFTLIEIVIASGMFVVVMFAAFEALRGIANSAAVLYASHIETRELETVASALRADATAAQGMRTATGCREIDFYQQDGGNAANTHYWGYRFVAANGSTPAQIYRLDEVTTPIVPCASAPSGVIVATHISVMRIGVLGVDDLDGSSGTMSAEPYLATPVRGGLSSLVAVGAGSYLGGNRVIEIALGAERAARTVDLVPGVMPGAYTVRLAYTCGKRSGCNVDGSIAANGPIAEVAGRAIDSCSDSYGEDTTSGYSRWTLMPYDGYTYVRTFARFTYGPETVIVTDYETLRYTTAPAVVPSGDMISQIQTSNTVDPPRVDSHAQDFAYCHGFAADSHALLPN